jgi:hypothetical protein
VITFEDGPAQGASLSLNRAPIWLRVVIAADGNVDALDQLDEEPRLDERVEVYRIARGPMRGFACGRGAGGSSSFLSAAYRHVPQPPEVLDEIRETGGWRDWVQDTVEREQKEIDARGS